MQETTCHSVAGRRLAAAILLGLLTAALAAAPARADDQQAQVTDFAFVPAAVAVKPGETVSWHFAGSTSGEHHNVHFEDEGLPPDPPSESHVHEPWDTQRTFMAAGAYRYFCDHHGGYGGQGMAGIVYVNADGQLPGSPPTAAFSVSTGVASTGEPVTFSGAGSLDPDLGGAIIRYEWDFDGNGTFDADGVQPTTDWTFWTPGQRTVGLRVTDAAHRTSVTTRTVTVTSKPVPALAISPAPAQPGQEVTFSAAGSSDPDGTIARYEWDLDGNGTYETDTGASPSTTRSYPAATTVSVTLRVTDDMGVSATTTKPLQISAPPPPPPPSPPPPAAVSPPAAPPPPSCDALKGTARATCIQKTCRTLKGTKKAACISRSCRYLSGSKRASCIQTSCRYVAKSKRASCGRASCRYLKGAKRSACQRKYRKP